MALEVASYWLGPSKLSSPATLFNAAFRRFLADFGQLHNTDMGARLNRCIIHANGFYAQKTTLVANSGPPNEDKPFII
jgi:hypothetical protein